MRLLYNTCQCVCVCVCVCVFIILWVRLASYIMFVRGTSPAEREISFFVCGSVGLVYAAAGDLCTDAVSCCGGCVVQRL